MALIVIAMEAAIAGVFFSQIDVSQTATVYHSRVLRFVLALKT